MFPPPFSSSPISKKNMSSFTHPTVNFNQPNNLQAQLNKVPLERSQSCSPTPNNAIDNNSSNQTDNLNSQSKLKPNTSTNEQNNINTFANIYTSAPIFKTNPQTQSSLQTIKNSTPSQIQNVLMPVNAATAITTLSPANNIIQPIPLSNNIRPPPLINGLFPPNTSNGPTTPLATTN
eukprot:jgi/Orpsp1_1/1189456/evm.model.d7180000072173.1